MRAMLCLLSFLCGLLAPFDATAQPDTLWTTQFRDAGTGAVSPVFYGATSLSDGSFAAVGVADPAAYRTDILVARISSTGAVLWSRVMGDLNAQETANAVVQTAQGTIVVVGNGGFGTTPNLLMLWGLSIDGDSLWSRTYTGQGWTQGSDAQLLPDGNIIITGYRLGIDGLHSDLWLLKCAPNGDTLWTRLHGAGGTDIGNRVLIAPNGKLIIGGSTQSWGAGDYDLWLLTADGSGQQITAATAGTSALERCYGMGIGGRIVWMAGRTANTGSVDNNGYLAKADTSGEIEWAQSFTVGRTDEQFRGVAALRDSVALCVGWAGSSAASPKPWIADVTSGGTLHSLWIGDGFQQGQLYGVLPIPNGGFLIYGTVMESNVRKGYLIRMGPGSGISGMVTDVETEEPLPGVRVGVRGSVQQSLTDAQGMFRLSLTAGAYDLVVFGPCVSSDTTLGVPVWEDSITWVELTAARPSYYVRQSSVNLVVYNHVQAGGPFVIYNLGAGEMSFSVRPYAQSPLGDWLSVNPGQGVVAPSDSMVIAVLVNASAPDDGVYDYYGLLDVHAHSCPDSTDSIPVLVTVLDAPAREGDLPAETALHAAYPNPFNALTRLTYSLPRAASVQLIVFDVTGREVRTLVEGVQEAGRHEVVFDGAGLAAGLYLVRMESGSFAGTGKLLLLK